MKANVILLILLFGFNSCGSFNFLNGSNPDMHAFKYYDSNFKLDGQSQLQTDVKYILVSGDEKEILIFFLDGFLNKYVTSVGSDISNIGRSGSGVIMGYYKTKGDSLFFTTKSYYQHRPTKYVGVIDEDTLKLEVKYPKIRDIQIENYVLYK